VNVPTKEVFNVALLFPVSVIWILISFAVKAEATGVPFY